MLRGQGIADDEIEGLGGLKVAVYGIEFGQKGQKASFCCATSTVHWNKPERVTSRY